MTHKIKNPFLLSGYKNPDYFCDRRAETDKIVEALENGRNLTLISPRRMGKSGLIHNAFYYLSKNEDAACYYIDIYNTKSLQEFVQLFASEIVGSLDAKSKKVIDSVFAFFKSVRPVITADELTGAPQITVDFAQGKTQESLKEIFNYLSKSNKTCYIAIDEFQQITNYKDESVEALLRSYVQRMTNVRFIFSGSRKHIMEKLFTSASQPFFQSTQMLQLGAISLKEYSKFILKHFEKAEKNIPQEAIDFAYQTVGGHTWYMQMLLNRLYSANENITDTNIVKQLLADILQENETTYQTYCKLITEKQFSLLKAIAAESEVQGPTAAEFIAKYKLGSTSTVSVSLKTLLNKELLLENNGKYLVYDRFFALWLKYTFQS
ncbi:MAG: ATP-binding protein [Tannerella sp.]|jgi:AAA+ ATPase superfamily predicted ATPase|nr:ATP-binding protein [Tannerella sp.]